jgi:hypothetical protein
MWWLNRDGHWVEALHQEGDGMPLPGLPENVFRASGAFNQIIFIDPDTGVVFTRIGGLTGIADAASSELVEGLAQAIRAARLDHHNETES